MVRMRLQWELGSEGRLTSHWVTDQTYRAPVYLTSRREDAECAPERAASYVRQARTAG